MKNKPALILTTGLLAFILYICQVSLAAATEEKPAPPQLESLTHKGKVVTTMDSGGYTYMEFEEMGRKLWVASRKVKVSVGDTIEFSRAVPMKDFHSKSLDRTFGSILFVNYVKVGGSAPPPGAGLPKGHIPIGKKNSSTITVAPGSVKKAENGYTVAECYSLKDSPGGKMVTVRGIVVKFTAKIMGKNWIHIRDGSGKKGTDDLTITSKQEVQAGDRVLVTGKIAYDRNFGSGYVYPVIIEDASIVVE